MTVTHAETFERCMAVGGVAVFPADTVYGLACDPGNRIAVERLYRMKRRALDTPSAVMFFDRSLALEALPELGPRTRQALERVWPGPVTALLSNPAGRYPLACGTDMATLGVRCVAVPELAGVRWPVLQSSANFSGEPDARTLDAVPAEIRRRCEMVIDGGPLPGTPSTVVDLREYEAMGEWATLRAGALDPETLAAQLQERYTFAPEGYAEMIREDIPAYEEMQAQVGAACAVDAHRVLELGTGTGETARRLLEANPQARLVGVDESAAMLGAAAARLPAERVSLQVGRLEEELPPGGFDLVASALCVHHLDGAAKRDLFARVRARLAPRGRFVLADLVVPDDPADVVTEPTPGYDLPDRLEDQLGWLVQAGFDPTVVWAQRDLAVVAAVAV